MKFNILAVATALFVSSFAHSTPIDPLIGTWKVIDHRTGYYISDIIIRKESNHQQYTAVIHKAYPRPGAAVTDICTQCEGVLRNQPLFGMQTLSNLVKNKQTGKYQNGIWLNHQDGQRYIIEGSINASNDMMKVTSRSQKGTSVNTLIWKKI